MGLGAVVTHDIPLLEEHHHPWHRLQEGFVPVGSKWLQVFTPMSGQSAPLIVNAFLVFHGRPYSPLDAGVTGHHVGPGLLVSTARSARGGLDGILHQLPGHWIVREHANAAPLVHLLIKGPSSILLLIDIQASRPVWDLRCHRIKLMLRFSERPFD